MSLLDEARQARRHNGINCAVQALRVADPALYAELMEALAAPSSEAPCSVISERLRKRGVSIGGNSLMRHRNGTCVRCRS